MSIFSGFSRQALFSKLFGAEKKTPPTEAWLELTTQENNEAWNNFISKFDCSPIDAGTKHTFGPSPSATFKIGHIYNEEQKDNELNQNLIECFQKAFRRLIKRDGWLYAIDVHHPCYRFYPHSDFELDEWGEWVVPILPDGDHHIFLERNLRFGVIGHPWEQTMCVFGQELLEALLENDPLLFTQMCRSNGKHPYIRKKMAALA